MLRAGWNYIESGGPLRLALSAPLHRFAVPLPHAFRAGAEKEQRARMFPPPRDLSTEARSAKAEAWGGSLPRT
jgi:hypothetical protein